MTTANKVTITRIFLIPIFVVELLYYRQTGLEAHRWAAIVSFATAAVCDGVDGFIARRFNQRSELGAILDPLADKLLLVCGLILLSLPNVHLGQLPIWLTGTVIGRDVLLLIGLGVIHMTVGKVVVRPCLTGKAATVLQILCIAWVLLKWDGRFVVPWFHIWTIGAALCTVISGAQYVLQGVRQLSSHPTSSASAQQH